MTAEELNTNPVDGLEPVTAILEAGAYTLSNIVGAEIGPSVALWNCDVQMKADDLTTEKVFTISNRKDKNVKCVAVEKPLPTCTP